MVSLVLHLNLCKDPWEALLNKPIEGANGHFSDPHILGHETDNCKSVENADPQLWQSETGAWYAGEWKIDDNT